MPVKASPAEQERGQRLARWLARVRPDLPKTRRGPAVFGVSRETVANWIKGADINNDAIVRILETGGCKALAEILGVPLPTNPIRATTSAKTGKESRDLKRRGLASNSLARPKNRTKTQL